MKKLFGFSFTFILVAVFAALGVYGAEEVVVPVVMEPGITEMFLDFVSGAGFWLISSAGAISVPGAVYGGMKVINAFKTLKTKVEDESTTIASLIGEIKTLKEEVVCASKNTTDAKTTLLGMITMMNMDGLKKHELLKLLTQDNLNVDDVRAHLTQGVDKGAAMAQDKATDLLKQLTSRL